MDNKPKELRLILLLFGGTGDLAKRKLYPSLFNLFKKGYLQEHFAVIGTARKDLDDDKFQELVRESIANNGDEGQVKSFAAHFHYTHHDVTDLKDYSKLKDLLNKYNEEYDAQGNRIFYMSVAPRFFGQIAEAIKSEGLMSDDGYNRLMVEKPFGTSYETAEKLQKQLESGFSDNQIFRIDHYLGKEMVQNIPAIRFGNPLIDATWNKDYIKNIQVTLAEKLGVEERAGYYNTAGALLDMIQNHTFQIVGWLAMEKPASFSDKDIRAAKNAAFSKLKIYDEEGVKNNFVRGQYGKGREVWQKAYTEEPDVPSDSKNDTYVAGRLQFDTDRWQGVPFYVRTGKRLSEKQTRVDIVYKKSAFDFGEFNQDKLEEPVLSILIDPVGRIEFSLNGKDVTTEFQTRSDLLSWQVSDKDKELTPDPYERMFHDAMNGDGSNFADWTGVSISWKFVDQIAKTWDEDKAPLETYESATMGPVAADRLLAETGDRWIYRG
ncbi:glucose-6-phosphate dehydrogenase [Oenococcus alcoholitolerans]|uniref:glucose-6-phosphate dehydrogenase n=1 Tax=Oenococcus alcoholitolerans TaxID=931074 RepID=UPI003F6EEAE8